MMHKQAICQFIILLDHVGSGLPASFSGPIHTPTLSKLADEGISYNAPHTPWIRSPTRTALLIAATTITSATARSIFPL